MSSSKIIAVIGIIASILGTAGVIAFLTVFPKPKQETQTVESVSQRTPAETSPQDTSKEAIPQRESEPKLSALAETSWELTAAKNSVGEKTYPEKSGLFSLTFLDTQRFGASSDCNLFGGTYTETTASSASATVGTINFSVDFSTEKACKESQESAFLFALKSASGFSLQNNALIITTRDHATLEFSPLSRQ